MGEVELVVEPDQLEHAHDPLGRADDDERRAVPCLRACSSAWKAE